MDIEQLIENIDIVDAISKHVKLTKTGSNYKGLCPFHNEKSPSFVVSPNKKIFKCFGCNVGGNVIEFYKKYHNIDFFQAVQKLNSEYNLGIVFSEEEEKKYQKKSVIFSVLREATNYFKENINKKLGKQAKKYLLERGLSEKNIIDNELGYADENTEKLYNFLLEKKFNYEQILQSGLITKKDTEKYFPIFKNRIIFPIYGSFGNVIGYGGRSFNERDTAKYINSPETFVFSKGDNLYGLINRGIEIKKKDFAILVEGYMDVLALHNIGLTNAVASLGTALTKNHLEIFKKYTKNIIIAYDYDNAGKMAAENAVYMLKNQDFNVKRLILENAKDPDEFIKKFGKEKFIEALKNSQSIIETIFKEKSQDLNLSDLVGKKILIDRMQNFFNSLKSDIEYEHYLKILSEKLNVNSDLLKKSFQRKFIKRKSKNISRKNSIKIKEKNLLELEVTKLALKNKKYLKEFEEKNFETLIYKKIIENIGNIDDSNTKKIFSNEEHQIYINILFDSYSIENEEELFNDLKKEWQNREAIINDKTKAQEFQKKRNELSDQEYEKFLQERTQAIRKRKIKDAR